MNLGQQGRTLNSRPIDFGRGGPGRAGAGASLFCIAGRGGQKYNLVYGVSIGRGIFVLSWGLAIAVLITVVSVVVRLIVTVAVAIVVVVVVRSRQ